MSRRRDWIEGFHAGAWTFIAGVSLLLAVVDETWWAGRLVIGGIMALLAFYQITTTLPPRPAPPTGEDR